MTPDDLERAVEEFRARRPLLDRFKDRLVALIGDLLAEEDRSLHQIEARCKDISTFKEKIVRKKYELPFDQMTDMVGLRVIMYYNQDVDFAAGIIRREFEIDEANSHDKRIPDENDRFGYESYHLVVSVANHRIELPEWRQYAGLKAEIQVRTVLQHAWAAVDHQLGYKNSVQLSSERRRRLSRVAAFLESADEVFDDLRNGEDQVRAAQEAEREEEAGRIGLDVSVPSAMDDENDQNTCSMERPMIG